MTRVVFYINVADRRGFLRRFLHRKVFLPRLTVLLFGSERAVDELDRLLWDDYFLPHQRVAPGQEMAAPIMLASEPPPPEHVYDMLISLAAEVPTALAGRYATYVDIVGNNDDSKQAGRRRYRYFQDHGYSVEIVDMAKRAA